MAERPRIPGGRQIHPEDFRQNNHLTSTAEERARRIERVRERTLEKLSPHLPEHREFMREAVGVLNRIIELERSRFGLSDTKSVVKPLIPEQFLLTTVNRPGSIGSASQIDGTAALSIVKMHFGSPEFFRVLMHEGIHLLDVSKFGYRQYSYLPRASGYEQYVHGRGAFRPFYEAVLEDYACDLMHLYRHLIEPVIVAKKDTYFEESQGVYRMERKLYEEIVSRLASTQATNAGDVKQQFRRGLFSGAFMPMRDIERALGRGTLRVLSAMDLYDSDSAESRDQYRKVDRFLDARGESRFTIGRDIMYTVGPMGLGAYLDRFYDPEEFGRMREVKAKDLTAKDLPALERSISVALMFVDSFRKGENTSTSERDKAIYRISRLWYKKSLQDLEEKRHALAPAQRASRPKRRKFLDIVDDLT
ncbi:hypothetical protein HY417_01475 [Candidatus Kaiserbacteria bacterium]|nr:hypothetical protein [Candidatus Kaiserbacteria bacterium]